MLDTNLSFIDSHIYNITAIPTTVTLIYSDKNSWVWIINSIIEDMRCPIILSQYSNFYTDGAIIWNIDAIDNFVTFATNPEVILKDSYFENIFDTSVLAIIQGVNSPL